MSDEMTSFRIIRKLFVAIYKCAIINFSIFVLFLTEECRHRSPSFLQDEIY